TTVVVVVVIVVTSSSTLKIILYKALPMDVDTADWTAFVVGLAASAIFALFLLFTWVCSIVVDFSDTLFWISGIYLAGIGGGIVAVLHGLAEMVEEADAGD